MNKFTQVKQHFHTNSFFPADAFLWEHGKAVYEFPFIQKVSDEKFMVHIQRHYANDPFALAEKAEWIFDNLQDAYQQWHNLENGIG